MRFVGIKFFFQLLFSLSCICSVAQNSFNTLSPKKQALLFNKNVIFEWNDYVNIQPTGEYLLTVASDSLLTNVISTKSGLISNKDSIRFTSFSDFFWKVEYFKNGTAIAKTATQKFTLIDIFSIPELSIFLRSDSGVVVNQFGKIEKWTNLIDTASSAVQSDTMFQPTLNGPVSELNGYYTVQLDGVDDLLQINNGFTLGEVYIIANWNGGNSFGTIKGLLTTKRVFTMLKTQGASNFANDAFFPNSEINFKNTRSFVPINEFKIVKVGRASGLNLPDLNIGRERTFPNTYWDGEIAEILSFENPLNDSLKGLVDSYLCQKYNPVFSLGPDIKSNLFCDTLITIDSGYSSYIWSNGDTTNSTHLTPGKTYQVTVEGSFGCKFSDEIEVLLPTTHPQNQFLCLNDSFIFDTQLPKSTFSFLWSDMSGDSALTINKPGKYHVTITDNKGCFYNSDTLNVEYDSTLFNLDLGNDTSLCSGNEITLKTPLQDVDSYLWSNGSADSSITVTTSQKYSVTVSESGCTNSDSINITIKGTAPAVNFGFENLCAGDSIQFIDSTIDAMNISLVRYNWNFGDGVRSQNMSPSHLYTSSGSFSVQLEVENDSNCTGIQQQVVTILPKPIADFYQLNSCFDDTIQFNSASNAVVGSISGYFWNFGVDYIDYDTSNFQNPDFKFPKDSIFKVSLDIITNNGCRDTVAKNVTINSSPLALFTYQGSTIADSIVFINNSLISNGNIESFIWDFGNGQFSTKMNPKVKYNLKGFYEVQLTAISDSGCVKTYTDSIQINDPPPTFNTVYPKENQTIGNATYFSWNAKDSAITYQIEVSDDSVFSSIQFKVVVGTKTTSGTHVLPSGKKFWRVIAKNGVAFDTTNVGVFTVFNISELDSLNLWLRADSGLATSMGRVNQWNDLSDSALSLSQASFSRQPTLLNNVLNGYSVVQFDDVDDQFTTPLNITGENFSISSVYSVNSTLGNSIIRGSNNWLYGPFLGDYRYFNGNSPDSKDIIPNQFVLQTVTSINDSASNFVNDIFYAKTKNAFPMGFLTIGFTPIDGQIAEIVIINGTLSNQERAVLDSYLMDKYAPPINLGPDRVVCSFPDSVTLDIDYALSYNWSTSDTTSTAIIDSPGRYYVTITDMFERTSVDSINFVLDTFNYQVNFDQADTNICKGDILELNAGGQQYTYSWNVASTAPSIEVDSTYLFVVDVMNCEGITSIDSIQVNVNSPEFDLGPDTTLCHNKIISLQSDSVFTNVSYQWSTNETINSILADTSGEYSLLVIDQYECRFADTVTIDIDSTLLGLTLGADTILCEGNAIQLENPNSTITSYFWSTGDNTPTTLVDTAGNYSVLIGNDRCFVSDTINVGIKGKAPIAKFGLENFCLGDSLALLDSSSVAVVADTIVSWQWQLGNGDTLFIQNPKYEYSARNKYSINLKVETDKGCSDTISKIIEIEPLPRANFGFQSSVICSKSRIFHEDSSSIPRGNIIAYEWNFGNTNNNQNTSQLRNPFHTYDTLGNYDVQLKVTSDEGCVDSTSKTLYVHPTPDVNFGYIGNCIIDSIAFFDSTSVPIATTLDYRWTLLKMGAGSFLLNESQNPSFKVNNAGDYIVSLRVRNLVNANDFCQDTKRDTIPFYESPEADFTVPFICENDSFTVVNNSSSSDSILRNRFVFNQTDTIFLQEPKFEGKPPGDYTLELWIESDKECKDSTSKILSVKQKPEVDFEILNNNTGIPFSVDLINKTKNAESYVWESGSGDSSTAVIPQFTYQDTGRFWLKLKASSIVGCLDSFQREIIALDKLIDADLLKVFLSENSLGDIEVSAQVNNSGNNTIHQLEMVADLNNEFEFRETFNTNMYSGRNDGFKFSSSFIPDVGRKVDFVCVRIISVNNENDLISANNELCEKGFSDELQINLFPNPVETYLNLQYTLPDDGEVELLFFDMLGRQMDVSLKLSQEEGYYFSAINLSKFKKGIYLYKFTFNGIKKVGKLKKN